MTYEEYYGSDYGRMKKAERQLLELLENYKREAEGRAGQENAVLYLYSRIKKPESMVQKLAKRGFGTSEESALRNVCDAIGVRAVCSFVDDVYLLAKWLRKQELFEIVEEKDYYANPKPNGYRSYHVLTRIKQGMGAGLYAEIQIRTIAMDFWAELEHQIKYKKSLPQEALVRRELKRCADEIASTDLSMQVIRDILKESGAGEESRNVPFRRRR